MAQLAVIQNGAGVDREWRPDVFHRVSPAQVGEKKLWWFQAVEGISILSENGVRRTRGKPRTVQRIWHDYAPAINGVAMAEFPDEPLHTFDVGPPSARRYFEIEIILCAVMATESGGRTNAERYEKHLNDWSFGPMQILTATAASANKQGPPLFSALKPVPRGGDPRAWRVVLADPEVSLRLAARLLRKANARWRLKGDPILLYACYNAGGPYASKRTPWGLRAYDRDGPGPEWGALDHFAAWYGDACAVYSGNV